MNFTKILFIYFAMNICLFSSGTSFTQEDREKLSRLEIKIERLEVKVEEGQKSLQKQIEDIKSFLLWGFGILFGGISMLIGFILIIRWLENINGTVFTYFLQKVEN